MTYVLLLDSSTVHVTNGDAWMRDGAPDRTRCELRVGAKWTVIASTKLRSDLSRIECCEGCKKPKVAA